MKRIKILVFTLIPILLLSMFIIPVFAAPPIIDDEIVQPDWHAIDLSFDDTLYSLENYYLTHDIFVFNPSSPNEYYFELYYIDDWNYVASTLFGLSELYNQSLPNEFLPYFYINEPISNEDFIFYVINPFREYHGNAIINETYFIWDFKDLNKSYFYRFNDDDYLNNYASEKMQLQIRVIASDIYDDVFDVLMYIIFDENEHLLFNSAYDDYLDFESFTLYKMLPSTELDDFTQGYNQGYNKGRGEYGYYQNGNWFTAEYWANLNYGNGYDTARDFYGIWYNQQWYTAQSYGDIRYNDGLSNDDDYFGMMIGGIFSFIGAIGGIELLPNLKIWHIVAVPMVFGIIYFILGRRRGDD